ncbi:MAG: RNase adapter RapZ [Candidatus Aminicenantes bacterium]|nr:RNase adapter RapZ [Candidatus Aminicenantes bacterium]
MMDYNFLIITGLSGSGKTAASRFLEDFGYYCMDNIPAKLIPSFVDLWRKKEFQIDKVAFVIDIREAGFVSDFPKVLKKIRKKVSPCVIFMEASDETLVQRFSESRRPHPLAEGGTVIENIQLERRKLDAIKSLSDEVIDTSKTNISDLKKLISDRFIKKSEYRIQIMLISFGYKYGVPLDSDLVFDTRFLPNPYYIDHLRDKTGQDKKVSDYIYHSEKTQVYIKRLFGFIDHLLPYFIEEGKSYLTISIGCTGGKHRSVAVSEWLKKHLESKKYSVQISHRDAFR